MRLASLHVSTPVVPFTTAFRHASAERSETATVWVTAETHDGIVGQGESCPRAYVTGETLRTAEAFVEQWRPLVVATISNIDTLRAFVATHARAIDASPAAWCAIELAVLDALGQSEGSPIEAVIGQPALTGTFTYSAVLGDSAPATFDRQCARYLALGFHDVKLKISGDPRRDYPRIERLADIPGLRLRVDANNLWADVGAALRYLQTAPPGIAAVEEPLAPRQWTELARLSEATGLPIVLDESVSRTADLDALAAAPASWRVNVRVSKMGGLLRALDVVVRARQLGVPVIVGAQVGETSVLTRAALPVAAAAGDLLRGQEGAFGTYLLERDVCDPPLMFGAGGRLDVADHPRLARAGLGIP